MDWEHCSYFLNSFDMHVEIRIPKFQTLRFQLNRSHSQTKVQFNRQLSNEQSQVFKCGQMIYLWKDRTLQSWQAHKKIFQSNVKVVSVYLGYFSFKFMLQLYLSISVKVWEAEVSIFTCNALLSAFKIFIFS